MTPEVSNGVVMCSIVIMEFLIISMIIAIGILFIIVYKLKALLEDELSRLDKLKMNLYKQGIIKISNL